MARGVTFMAVRHKSESPHNLVRPKDVIWPASGLKTAVRHAQGMRLVALLGNGVYAMHLDKTGRLEVIPGQPVT